MSTNTYIKPQTTAILGGGSQHTVRANPTVSPAGSASGNSRWGKFKSFARKAGAFIKQGLQFINANIIPTVAVVTGFLNAWNKFQGYRTAERVAA